VTGDSLSADGAPASPVLRPEPQQHEPTV